MPRPSIVGTAAITTTAAEVADVTMTIPAGANLLLCAFGGFANGAALTVTSVQGDPTGTPYDLNDGSVYAQRTTNQYAGIYVIDDQNVNWPGTGSVTVRVTMSGGSNNRQLKAALCCLQDVDTAATYINGTQTGTGTSSTPSMASLSSSSNALNIGSAGSYSADTGGGGDDTLIIEDQNSTASSSLYVWHEDGAGATDTVEANGTVDWAAVCMSLEGTGGGGGGLSIPVAMHHYKQMGS